LLFLRIQVPKNLLKSRDFQEECILSAIQILSAHFAQWSYHVSFPEVATIPLVLLKRLHEQTTVESLRRPIKRLIDQVNRQSKILHVVTMQSKDIYTLHGTTIQIIRQEH
jgi:nucleolar complex protein 2